MKSGFWMLSLAAAFLLLTAGRSGFAQETKEQDANTIRAARTQQRFELTKEMIDRFMEDLSTKDPEKAKELSDLQKKDPAKFEEQIRTMMREQRRQRMPDMRGRGDFGPSQGRFGDFNRPREGRSAGGQRGPGGRNEPRPWRDIARDRQEEFIKWLNENYPDEAEKLESLRENQELFDRQLGILMRRYFRIYITSRDNPELAEVLKQDHVLMNERNDILRRLSETTQATKREELKAQLTAVISARYDLIVKRTELEYKQLSKRLEELKKQIDNWKDESVKQEKVKEQVNELTDPNRIPVDRD